MKNDFCLKMGYCFDLEYLDLSGNVCIDDMFVNLLQKAVVTVERKPDSGEAEDAEQRDKPA